MTYPDVETKRRTVLVAVVNNMDDLRRAASDGWYRIPQRRAPQRVGADYLAFYQTGAFRGAEEAQTVTYFAPTRRYRLVTRRELLPGESEHPRPTTTIFGSRLDHYSVWKGRFRLTNFYVSPLFIHPWIACCMPKPWLICSAKKSHLINCGQR